MVTYYQISSMVSCQRVHMLLNFSQLWNTGDWSNIKIQQDQWVDALYFDFKKACNKVPHNIRVMLICRVRSESYARSMQPCQLRLGQWLLFRLHKETVYCSPLLCACMLFIGHCWKAVCNWCSLSLSISISIKVYNGITEKHFDWIRSLFQGRKQRVTLDGAKSLWTGGTYATRFCPWSYFLCVVYDLLQILNNYCVLVAYDTKIYSSVADNNIFLECNRTFIDNLVV